MFEECLFMGTVEECLFIGMFEECLFIGMVENVRLLVWLRILVYGYV